MNEQTLHGGVIHERKVEGCGRDGEARRKKNKREREIEMEEEKVTETGKR